jgi:hypothetical protein
VLSLKGVDAQAAVAKELTGASTALGDKPAYLALIIRH